MLKKLMRSHVLRGLMEPISHPLHRPEYIEWFRTANKAPGVRCVRIDDHIGKNNTRKLRENER
jgi:hypothetical protein